MTVIREHKGISFLGGDHLDEQIIDSLLESHSRVFFPKEIKDSFSGLVLDIGAHHGLFAIACLRKYPDCKVICVEPDPKAVERINKNLELNGISENKVEVITSAIGNKEGFSYLTQLENRSWSNYCHEDKKEDSVRVTKTTVISVLNGKAPDFIKCNGEGAEYSLFPEIFKIGIFPKSVSLFGHPEFGDLKQLLELFENHGYKVTPTCCTEKRPRYVCSYEESR